ncbi:wall-associated receptor kinase-like 10 [Miscanthus floridulus]|uniref:wall-associated receptor kinase-like 10 n=1 Tax=Miscanthus floridulus TaxID=154761 RepID=UPI003459D30E
MPLAVGGCERAAASRPAGRRRRCTLWPRAAGEVAMDPLLPGHCIGKGISVAFFVALLIVILLNQVFLNKEKKRQRRQQDRQVIRKRRPSEGYTHGFHKANIVGEGAHGTVHKATLGTDTVAVKRCKQIEKSRTDEFVQELVVPKGTLAYLDPEFLQDFQITEKTHIYSFGVVLIELLTGKNPQAKEWKNLTTTFEDRMGNAPLVVPKGTLAYLGPEFLQDFQITEKTHIYSFGVVLIELLTGKNPQAKEWKNLTTTFEDRMGNGTLGELLDADIIEEGSMELIYAAAKLVTRCIAAPGNAIRPAMGQVAVELRRFSYEMPESPEARAALEVEDGSFSGFSSESTRPNIYPASASTSTQFPFSILLLPDLDASAPVDVASAASAPTLPSSLSLSLSLSLSPDGAVCRLGPAPPDGRAPCWRGDGVETCSLRR